MQFASLEVFGMHRLVIDAWRRDFGEELLPIQQKAVRAGVLQGRRVLAVAPASSGKTLIAEMAIASAAMSRSKSLYLVPTRALAAEKLGQLSARFAPAGLRTIISTRDHPFSDPVALRGDFDVLVAVP
ncbi:MAG: DEAD/DEAH box helicase, partial [Armatimonadetes bacterium]|nr:DEAD/DEAH box helicase [Armatimonadota bacterium]